MFEFLAKWKSCTDLGVGEYDEDSPEAWAILVGSSCQGEGLSIIKSPPPQYPDPWLYW